MNRNPFFYSSGFELQEVINILENISDNKKRLDRIKEQKRAEHRLHKFAKHNGYKCSVLLDILIKVQKSMTTYPEKRVDQIQRGIDLAKEWGWDGLDKTYHPNLMKV